MWNSTWIRELRNFCIPWTWIFSTSVRKQTPGTPALNLKKALKRDFKPFKRDFKKKYLKRDFDHRRLFPLRCNIPADLNSLDLEIPKVPSVAHLDPKGSRKRFETLSTCAGQLLFQPGFPTVQKTSGMGGGEPQIGGGSHHQGDSELKLGMHRTQTRWESMDMEELWD